MPTFGCHSCGVDITKYKCYEDSPCATCPLAQEYNTTHHALLFDSADEEASEAEMLQMEAMCDMDEKTQRMIEYETQRDLEKFKEVVEAEVFSIAASVILDLLKLAKTNPTMFEVVIKKIQWPFMSYSELGNSMNPKCSKQNVLYHLKHAVAMFPDLAKALITDMRFSAGKNALQTVANHKRQISAKQHLKDILYGEDNERRKRTIDEINQLLSAPFMSDLEVIDFNPYTKPEMRPING